MWEVTGNYIISQDSELDSSFVNKLQKTDVYFLVPQTILLPNSSDFGMSVKNVAMTSS
jgi:hypothetical protein